MLYGRTSAALPSRFLKEIPEDCIVRKGGFRTVTEPIQGRAYNSSYLSNKKPLPKRPESAMVAAAKATTYLELNQGDMVLHAAFGRGMVLSVMKMSGDALLEIAFDDIGTKKLMAKTASAHMKKL